jgi:hypothetical protein
MFEEEDIVVKLVEQNKELRKELRQERLEHKELQDKYINLKCRYTNQNDELIRLKIELRGRKEEEDYDNN